MPTNRKKARRSKRTAKDVAAKSDTSQEFDMVVDLWIKEPPSGTSPIEDLSKLPSLYTSEMDEELPIVSRLLVISRTSRFQETKNPILAIEAFLIAREMKLYPPMWVLDWLEKSFKTFHDAQGKQSFDKILGLVPGRGQSPLFKTLIEEERDQMLALDMWRLIVLFNVSIDRAAEMVARRLEDAPRWNKTAYEIRPLAEKTLVDRYKKKWKKVFDSPEQRHRLLRSWTKLQADEYLKKFPADAYGPEDIRPSITR